MHPVERLRACAPLLLCADPTHTNLYAPLLSIASVLPCACLVTGMALRNCSLDVISLMLHLVCPRVLSCALIVRVFMCAALLRSSCFLSAILRFNCDKRAKGLHMATGRICPRCFQDVVLVCPCRTSSLAPHRFLVKRPRADEVVAALPRKLPPSATSPPPQSCATSALVGTSMALEKSYTRPSSAPVIANIRPLEVLKRAFLLCIQRPQSDVAYVFDQLKGIRQDLTVQGADSHFKAAVYEFHARLCLLLSHLPEFGQCLHNIHALHAKGFHGDGWTDLVPSATIAGINPPSMATPASTTPTAAGPAPGQAMDAAVGGGGQSNQAAGGGLVSLLSNPAPTGLVATSKIEFAAFRIVYTGLMSRFEDDVAMALAWLERSQQHHAAGTPAGCGHSGDQLWFDWDHPLVRFAMQAVNNRHNPMLYLTLAHRAPTKSFRALLHLFVPRLRIDWLKTLVNGMDSFLSDVKLHTWLGLGSTDGAANLFRPIVGHHWRNGFDTKQCRATLNAYITEVTEQRGAAAA